MPLTCACLVVGLFTASNIQGFSELVGNRLDVQRETCPDEGAFSFEGHEFILSVGPVHHQTHYRILIPYLAQTTPFTYCLGNATALFGATHVPVTMAVEHPFT